MLTIYGNKTFNAVKAVLTAQECGVEYDYKVLDFATGEHKTPDYMKIHPLGKIPAMTDNGNPIFESNNMCRYITNISGKTLYSDDALEAAKIDQTIDFIGYHVGKWIAVYFFQEIVMKFFRGADADAEAIDEAAGFLAKQLPYLDGLLEANEFLCGERITIADTIGFAMFMTHEYTTFDIIDYENIQRWYAMMKARPSYSAMMEHFPGGYDFG